MKLLFNSVFDNGSGKEAVLITTALTLGLLIPASAFAMRKFTSNNKRAAPLLPLEEVKPLEVFTRKELSTILISYDNNDDGGGDSIPEGKLLRDRHGFTRYVLEKPDSSGARGKGKGLIVLVHGLGTSLEMYKDLSDKFVKEGYSVLRYDFYGHGYSKYGNGGDDNDDLFIEYSTDILADQLEDLLEYIDGDDNDLVGIVGHSAGGLAAIAFNDRRGRKEGGPKGKVAPKLCLACPALYSKKPIVAQIADRIPNVLTSLLKTIRPLLFIVGDSYLEAGEIAFGKDPQTKKVIYKKEEEQVLQRNRRLFGKVRGVKKHPFLEAAILGINCFSLREDLQPGLRKILLNVLQNKGTGTDGDAKCNVQWVWGNLDVTVPYKENIQEVETWAMNNDNFHVKTLDRIGHEMFYENSSLVFESILPFFNEEQG